MNSLNDNKDNADKDVLIPEVIYIMGTARSGTTILEVLLKSNPDAFGAGEATHIFKDSFRDNVVCACSKPSLTCFFWQKVYRNLNWQRSKLQETIDVFRDIEWHKNFPLLFLNLVTKKKMRLYKDHNRRLFNAIQAASGKMIIIDSSKYAGRAMALTKIFPGKVKVLCMTRSPVGLLNAFKKRDIQEQKPKSLLGTLLYYIYALASCRLVSFRIGKGLLKLKYEDLVSRPVTTLTEIESWSGLDLSKAKTMINQGDFFDIGHIVTGNRLRLKGMIQFHSKSGTQSVNGFRERAVLGLMNLACMVLRF